MARVLSEAKAAELPPPGALVVEWDGDLRTEYIVGEGGVLIPGETTWDDSDEDD